MRCLSFLRRRLGLSRAEFRLKDLVALDITALVLMVFDLTDLNLVATL